MMNYAVFKEVLISNLSKDELPGIDSAYLLDTLSSLMEIPSPSGFTKEIVEKVTGLLQDIDSEGISIEQTRRGAIRASLKGEIDMPRRALVAHLDTLGAMVKRLKPNGRLEVVPIGSWSSRFAEGARVTIFTEDPNFSYRGTILPVKASGHTYDREIDELPIGWEHVELRVDQKVHSVEDLRTLNIEVGDYIAVDPQYHYDPKNRFINSRHLDNKAGTACLLAAVKAVQDSGIKPPTDCYALFTIFEEVGAGASAILHGSVSELIAIDNATVASVQNSSEYGVTIGVMDSSGPFDHDLVNMLVRYCRSYEIEYRKDVFKFYRCDAASALEAGNDIRAGLMGFGVDGSHGYERVHLDSLIALARLMVAYILNTPVAKEDKEQLRTI